MMLLPSPRRWLPWPLVLLTLAAVALPVDALAAGKKGKRASRSVQAAVVRAPVPQPVIAPAPPAKGFAPQTRLGHSAGDQWEPALAADSSGHVYVLYPQYLGVPGCPECPSPTLLLQRSADGGKTWDAPRPIAPPGSGQWDAQIAVDPVDGRTVYASWLQNNKSDTVVARSDDFGTTWRVVVADSTKAGTDKPILAVRGQDVYVGFNHAQKVWVAASHDGGASFTVAEVRPNAKLGWSLAGGGTVAPSGTVLFAWAGYERNGGATGAVHLYVSRSTDGGRTWSTTSLDTSRSPPDCSSSGCGWAFLGAQMTLASDAAGGVYALWNASREDRGPARMFFSRSQDGGATWRAASEVSLAAARVMHAFPAMAASGNGQVRIAWMDQRAGSLWNTRLRSSHDGGATWSEEAVLSSFVAGYDYIHPGGFSFPFGDYFELAVDGEGTTHAIWGEGLNYDSPGSIWYTRGR